jgi:uncharacterized protein (TIGR03089 family)
MTHRALRGRFPRLGRVTSPDGPPQLLDAALRRDPARPLLTFYDDATGERTELSVTTFANWVSKTANLLRDDLGMQPGGVLSVDLPVHWQAAVWLQAAWALGLHVVPAGGPAEVAVLAYDGTAPSGATDVVALGLGALAMPRRDAAPPAGTTLDYDREVLGHGDRFVPGALPDPAAPALTVGTRTLTGAGLAAVARAQGSFPAGARLLVTEPLTTLEAVLAGLLVPLATEVTAVLCRHLDPVRLPGRIEQEMLVGAVGRDTPEIPRWAPVGSEGGPG